MYADSTAVIGPLSREAEPHAYDLCVDHARTFTVPRGWSVMTTPTPLAPEDDVLALAKALGGQDSTGERSRFSRVAPADADTAAPARRARAAGEGRHLSVVRSPRDD